MDLAARVAQRLASCWTVDVWSAVCVKAIAAGVQQMPGGRAKTPAHFLAAAWPPAAQGPVRWPEAVAIGSPDAHHALHALLAQLPPVATLYLATLDDVDAALAAEIIVATDRNLEEYQREALLAFAVQERARTRARAVVRYTDRDAGYERFRQRATGNEPDT